MEFLKTRRNGNRSSGIRTKQGFNIYSTPIARLLNRKTKYEILLVCTSYSRLYVALENERYFQQPYDHDLVGP